MKERFKNLPLRSGVGIVVLNKNNKVFVAKRIDNPKNFWQMPQGGVNNGENFLTAAYRELEEEINVETKNPEFLDWKWIELDQITEVVVDFKLHVYKELKEKVKRIIN